MQDFFEGVVSGVRRVGNSPVFRENPYSPANVNIRINSTWKQLRKSLSKPWKKDLSHGEKPTYRNPGHHDPDSPNFRGGGDDNTTILPNDAQAVYERAIPRKDGRAWYGRNSDNEIYRYSVDEEGFVHWNGRENSKLGLPVPAEIKSRFRQLDKSLENR